MLQYHGTSISMPGMRSGVELGVFLLREGHVAWRLAALVLRLRYSRSLKLRQAFLSPRLAITTITTERLLCRLQERIVRQVD